VQSKMILLQPSTRAPVGVVAFETLTHVFTNPYADPTTGTWGATFFNNEFATILLLLLFFNFPNTS
jgi:hypothetical protein